MYNEKSNEKDKLRSNSAQLNKPWLNIFNMKVLKENTSFYAVTFPLMSLKFTK